jgi:hypothetical protein
VALVFTSTAIVLRPALTRQSTSRRFQIAMDDPLLVHCLQSIGDLARHDEVIRADVMDGADVGMIQGSPQKTEYNVR